nr:DUF3987 domain-containing protein [uncultured Flavobacterium sp.]
MNKKIFNPKEWLEAPAKQEPQPKQMPTPIVSDNQFENYLQQIENTGTDITQGYDNWRNIGFALADEFGEMGRDYFHRISKFNSAYDYKECDVQYNNCLKAKGTGVTMATIYYLAQQNNIKIHNEKPIVNNEVTEVKIEKTPVFPSHIYETLPLFLKDCVKPATTNEERDILLLGTLTTLSACLPSIYGIYDGKKVMANLYLFVTAPASAGKGRLTQCKQLVQPIHRLKREQATLIKKEYEANLAMYNQEKGKNPNAEKPAKPPERMLFIPANNSTTGVFQLLFDNNGEGLIFETEGDTLAQAFKSDYGNYSDGFRKAYHHETISYYRRTDREYVDIENPCLSTVLSGTPKQVSALIPNAENGLFSRFMFYYMNITPIWKNVFEIQTTNGLDDYYNELGGQFLEFYKALNNNPSIQIKLSQGQQLQFNKYFSKVQTKYLNIQTDDYIATIRRMGLNAFRLMMVITTLRIMEDGDCSTTRECEDIDFQNVLDVVTVLTQHSSKVFNDLPVETPVTTRTNRKEKFLEMLPEAFTTADYLAISEKLTIPHKTAEGYITAFAKAGLIHREMNGKYRNTSKQGNKDFKGN